MLMFNEGKVAKYRASCDSCNETKVRCSQTKPQCERCVKQGIACIYGLSRRSHKTAPRVGASRAEIGGLIANNTTEQQQQQPPLLYPPQPPQLLPSPDTTHADATGSSTGATTSRATPPLLQASSYNSITSGDLDSLPGFRDGDMELFDADGRRSSPEEDFSLSDWPLLDSGSFGLNPDLDLPHSLSLDSLKGRSDSFGAPHQTNSLDSSRSDSPLSLHNLAEKPHNLALEACSCRALATKQLEILSVPPDSCGPNEVYFSHLKRAISIAEMCLGCRCISDDDTCMLTIGALLSNTIERLDYLMTQASQLARPHSRATSTSTPNNDTTSSSSRPNSRLWGALEIEPQEEAELTFHLYIIQLRKLRGILNKMMASIDSVDAAEGRGNSAKAMTVQYIYVWLTRKVKTLKTKNANLPLAT